MGRNDTLLTGTPSRKGSFASTVSDPARSSMQYAKVKREAPGLLGKRARRSLNQGMAGTSRSSSSLTG